jgi:integrase
MSKRQQAPQSQYTGGENHAFQKTTFHRFITALNPSQPQFIYLCDGELILYRRARSLLYQCRYKLADGTWYRQGTGKASVEHAIAVACDIYDEARYRQRLGLAH